MKNYDVYGKVNRDSPGTEFGQKGFNKFQYNGIQSMLEKYFKNGVYPHEHDILS